MATRRNNSSTLVPLGLLPLLVILVVAFAATPASAFGSGVIAEVSNQHGRAFLHGDIESTLVDLVKTTASAGFISGLLSGGKKAGKKFTKDDADRVYFGNWLRDMSQAIDVSSLKLLPAQRIVNVVAVLGFLHFGYATREFEVTPERLTNYNTIEHIDNPTGYPDDQGSDPRVVANYDKLRGPLDPREVEIDERNGMKNYIATEGREWDTASRFIKDNLVRCIELGRSGRRGNQEDEWESLRLLGTALHTLEDFPAHSNFTEVCLNLLGYDRVFTHVGDNVRIRSPSGRQVSPIVTGSFGGADFMHSMLGTAQDKIAENGVQDLSSKFGENKNKDSTALRKILKLFLSKGDSEDDNKAKDDADGQIDRLDELKRRAQEMNPIDMSEEEVHNQIMEVLKIHDDIMRKISAMIERIPMLSELIDETSNTLQVFIYSTLEPIMAPILENVTKVLFEASAAVVDNHDQTIVFNDENASDPTHSMLAKDHFGNVLNACAGQLAQIILKHTVNAVVEAWDDDSIDPRRVAESAVQALHHPDFVERKTPVQEEMFRHVEAWINSHGSEKEEVLRRLEKDSVLSHRNNTNGLQGGTTVTNLDNKYQKYGAATQGLEGLVKPGGILADAPGADLVAGVLGGLKLNEEKMENKQSYQQQQSSYGQGGQSQGSKYGREEEAEQGGRYGGRREDDEYGGGRKNQYGREGDNEVEDGGNRYGGGGGGRHQSNQGSYGGHGRQEEADEERESGNRFGEGRGGRRHENENQYESSENRYGGGRRNDEEESRYGGERPPQQRFGGGGGGGYGRQEEDEDRFNGRGGGRRIEEDEDRFQGRGYGERREEEGDRFGGNQFGGSGRSRFDNAGGNEYGGNDEERRGDDYGYGGSGRRRGGDDDNGYERRY